MGTYQDAGQMKKKSAGGPINVAVADFGASFIKASEIEYVDMPKMKELAAVGKLPIEFLMINACIDQVLNDMRQRFPGGVMPQIKEHKRQEK